MTTPYRKKLIEVALPLEDINRGPQAVQMQWDFAETNPFAGAGGDFVGTVESLCEVLENLAGGPAGHVVQQAAQHLRGRSQFCFSTDLPYYDDIGYADLFNFFTSGCAVRLASSILASFRP